MKKTLLSVALTSALASTAMVSTSAFAVEGLSGNVGVTSDYIWRGVTQTDNGPAVSAGVDYELGNGAYVGAWASNIDGGVEFDLYGGYSAALTKDVTYDVGYIFYGYDESDFIFSEIYGSLAYKNYSLTYSTLAHSEGGDFADSGYLSLDAEFDGSSVYNGLTFGAHVGNAHVDADGVDSVTDFNVSASYNDFSLLLSKSTSDGDAGDVVFALSYTYGFDL